MIAFCLGLFVGAYLLHLAASRVVRAQQRTIEALKTANAEKDEAIKAIGVAVNEDAEVDRAFQQRLLFLGWPANVTADAWSQHDEQ